MNHKDMEVWKKAIDLAVVVNEAIKGFPLPESKEIISHSLFTPSKASPGQSQY